MLNLRISTLTKEKVEELKKENEKIENEIAELEGKTPSDLWISDLNSFRSEYNKFMKEYYILNDLNQKDYEKSTKKINIVFKK